MLIAILVALGVSAGTILVLLIALVLFKRIKTVRSPDVFKARVRLTEGEFPGLSAGWKKGYGAWVLNVLTLRRGIALNIADIVPTAQLKHTRTATPDETTALKLGDRPVIVALVLSTGAKVELAVGADRAVSGRQPYATETRAAPEQIPDAVEAAKL